MSLFAPKQLSSDESFGHKLRQARLNKQLKLDDLAKTLNIRRQYLAALEDDHWEDLPAGLYSKNFLKKYAQKLGLPQSDIKAQLDQSLGVNASEDPFSQKIVKKREFIIFPKFLKNTLIILAVLTCLLYLIFYFQRSLRPPHLEIHYPDSNLLINDNHLNVSGQTEPEVEIKINDALVLSDKEGYFSQTVNLKKGLNTITITAKKKYGREKIELRQILVE